MSSTTRSPVVGASRDTVPAVLLVTQTLPKATITPNGALPALYVAVVPPVTGSTFDTEFPVLMATQTLPIAMPTGFPGRT